MRRANWMRFMLWAAALYHIVWGALIVVFPVQTSRVAGVNPAGYPELWQGFGMVFGTFGIGYAIAARNPFKHWLLIFVTLLGKILGPLGFFFGALRAQLRWSAGWAFVTDDLIWVVPFSGTLYHAYHAHRARGD